ncbi:MAG: hypothetical protein AAF270_15920 [Pseudomonadota bacterium]
MQHKALWTAFALAICLLAFTGVADELSESYAATALERAFVTWAVARGLNGVISVAQGTEIALEPGGVGVNLTVGQILDPVNDLIEQFSSIMLVATTAIGLQNVLLTITGSFGVSAFLAVSALFALVVLWWPSLHARERLRAFALRLLLVTFMLRFAVPFLLIGSNFVFDQFLSAEQQQSTEALRVATEEIEQISEEKDDDAQLEERNMLQRFGDMVGESFSQLNVRERLDALSERASGASRHVVNLIVIFMLQTILLPLAFLWLLMEAVKSLAGRATRW